MFIKLFSGRCVCYTSASFFRQQPTRSVITRTFCSDVPARPKEPVAPYFAFIKNQFAEVSEKHAKEPKMRMKEVHMAILEAWNDLPDEEKSAYEGTYVKELLKYKLLKKQWWSNLSEEQKSAYFDAMNSQAKIRIRNRIKKKMRELGKPPRPPGALTMFAVEQRNFYSDGTDVKEAYKNNLNLWKNLPIEEKKPYYDKSKEYLKVYHLENNVWELQMMKKGYGDLIQQAKGLRRRKEAQMRKKYKLNG